ncbi:MAG TPA: hypothetical protein VGD17_01245 [Chitinophagaceae bacterium]
MKLILLLRYVFLAAFILAGTGYSYSQGISAADRKQLQKKEDSLKKLSRSMVFSTNPSERFRADSNFVRTLVRTLLVKNSFNYPLDSVAISKLYAPDSSFRIFTWQLQKDEYVYLQKGAIQMKTPDGSLKLFPLHDVSMFSAKPWDSVRNRQNWVGAIYYRIVLKTFNNKKYYTLLGFDDFSVSSNKKWMEVLSFNENGEPVFGGPFISITDSSAKVKVLPRFNIEYKKEAKTFFNYDPELDMIVYDHLISESNEPDRRETFIPDGDFQGFKWQNGQWVHVDKVFNFQLKDGQFPMDEKLLDDSGKPDEEKLQKASDRNIEKQNPSKDPKKTNPPKKTGGGN